MQVTQHEVTIPPQMQGQRLDQALAGLFPDYSRSRIKDWILAGQVMLDGESVAPRTRVEAGQQVILNARLEPLDQATAMAMPLDLVYSDDDLLVINKPAGLVVHPGAGNREGTLVSGLLHRWPELAELPRAGLLHRLDKDTTGLLLVARSIAAHTRLVRDLQERDITREYRAVCVGSLTAGGRVDAAVGRHPVIRTRMAVISRGGREAVTHYRVLQRFPAHSFLALRLETGRTHQIRVHMAHIRHPLVGDATYGGRRYQPPGASQELLSVLRSFPRQALHASDLSFQHPRDGRPLSFHAPLPADMVELLLALAGPGADAGRFERMVWTGLPATSS